MRYLKNVVIFIQTNYKDLLDTIDLVEKKCHICLKHKKTETSCQLFSLKGF